MSVDIDADDGEVRTTRSIGRSGNSTIVRLPPEMLNAIDMEEGDEVVVTASIREKTISLKEVGEQTDD